MIRAHTAPALHPLPHEILGPAAERLALRGKRDSAVGPDVVAVPGAARCSRPAHCRSEPPDGSQTCTRNLRVSESPDHVRRYEPRIRKKAVLRAGRRRRPASGRRAEPRWWRWLSDKDDHLYESDNGSSPSPRESASGGSRECSETGTAHLKPAVLWQCHNFWRPRRFVRQPRRGAGHEHHGGESPQLFSRRATSAIADWVSDHGAVRSCWSSRAGLGRHRTRLSLAQAKRAPRLASRRDMRDARTAGRDWFSGGGAGRRAWC